MATLKNRGSPQKSAASRSTHLEAAALSAICNTEAGRVVCALSKAVPKRRVKRRGGNRETKLSVVQTEEEGLILWHPGRAFDAQLHEGRAPCCESELSLSISFASRCLCRLHA